MNRARLFLVVLAVLVLSGCGRADARAWLASAQAAHETADRRLREGDVDGARRVLQDAASAPVPKSATRDDARVVRQDFYARLSTLEVERGDAKEAVVSATAGLALGRAEDVFTANLLIARGHALAELEDARAASADYHDALVVTEALLDRTLKGSEQRP